MMTWLKVILVSVAATQAASVWAVQRVDFNRDIEPILSENCFTCHGPDANKRKAKLRLDLNDGLATPRSKVTILVPGRAGQSELYRHITNPDDDERMPPPKSGKKLSAQQVELIRRWIEQGATWQNHWAYEPLRLPAVPAPRDRRWARNPIDRFVLARLEQEQLQPSAEASPEVLIRRVTLDLTGLLPTPAEVRDFLADKSPGAYVRLVDRLLASPRYGERWARHWLDVAHYADTHGHDQDRPRPNAWPYRDYVIHAFNEDKPYARFVQEQLAGDILFPDDPQGIVALGFLAAGPWDESSQMHIMADTVDKKIAQNLDRDDMLTTAVQTFLSTGINCARCHDHKFDPISQAEYYSLQAVFAGIDRVDRPFDSDPKARAERQQLLRRKASIETWIKDRVLSILAPATPAELTALAVWEKNLAAQTNNWTVLDPVSFVSAGGATLTKQTDGSVLASGVHPDKDTYTIIAHTAAKGITAVRLEVLADDSLPVHGPGREDNGNFHLSEIRLEAAPLTNAAAAQPVALQNPSADFSQQDWDVAQAIDGKLETAWAIHPQEGAAHVAIFETKQDIGGDGGIVLKFILDQQQGKGRLIGRPRLSLTTSPRPVRLRPPLPESIASLLVTPAARRSEQQRAGLLAQFRLDQITQQLAALPAPQMVYAVASDFPAKEKFTPAKTPRPIFLLNRGEVTQPGPAAMPSALACVNELPARLDLADAGNEGARRAAFARWVADPRNALTWRSIVNRVWHYHFGHGLVETPNDFGRMGARPSHPELLDWLAATFRDDGGSFKQLHRLIVTSATYRQSSAHNAAFAKRDADNRLLWRMNRERLDAEEIRDVLLALTGLLDLTMGGPAAMQFVFQEAPGDQTPLADYARFDVDSPASRRRSIYRYLFRTKPDPFMDSLDCPDATQLTPRRNVSVTALQALSLWHDRFVVRQCEHLAARIAKEDGPDPGAQIGAAYELALGRAPTPTEQQELVAFAAKFGLPNACRVILNSNEFMFVP